MFGRHRREMCKVCLDVWESWEMYKVCLDVWESWERDV